MPAEANKKALQYGLQCFGYKIKMVIHPRLERGTP